MQGTKLRPQLLAFLAIAVLAFGTGAAAAAQDAAYRTSHGIAAYLGVMPAQIVKGHRDMHGGAIQGARQYHVMAALFDTAISARITDAKVTATVAPLGLAGETKTLEAMKIDDTLTYGNFFGMRAGDRYTIRLEVLRAGAASPVVLEFSYDHRIP
jgi:hypothetical protein